MLTAQEREGVILRAAAWSANCGRMSGALKALYGLNSGAVGFFDLFANSLPADDTALAVFRAA